MSPPVAHLRLPVGAAIERMHLDLPADRVDDPVLRHPVAREHPHLAAAVDGHGGRRQHLDDDVRRNVRDGVVAVEKMHSFGAEENDIGLHDIVLVEHDIERRGDGTTTSSPP